jgi:hypothetical protein
MPSQLFTKRRSFNALLSLSVYAAILLFHIFFFPCASHARETFVKKDVGRVVFGVNTVQAKRELVTAIGDTWGAGETLVITDCMESAFHKLVKRTSRAPCSEYPPVISWVAVLKEMSTVQGEWYMKVDDDTYVNKARLRLILEQIHLAGYTPNDFLYLGAFAAGREHERDKLGLNGEMFAMGGTGILMSRFAMEKVASILDSCMLLPAQSMHSDTQLARCVYLLSLNYTATHVNLVNQFAKCFKAFYPEHTINTTRTYEGSTVPLHLTENDLERVTLHSVKTSHLMHSTHNQFRQHLAKKIPLSHRCN